ncbi:LysR substrate-binding domain-containing protein [Caldimonas sp. KR1-144]|uniref:LysR family transcriptional regulator n=1 Tax=Caldimonas sp. KR1-144 TaxID=3400911 RepID=UPI003C02A2EB
MDRLKTLSIFKAIADHGGFSRAAEALEMSPAQVTRSVHDLEAELGVQLLQRTTRRVSLTGIGQEVLERARGLLDQYEELADLSRATTGEASGSVRVLAPTFVRHLIAPVLAQYRARFPKVAIDLRLSDRAPDLVAEEADLALCRQQDLRPSLVARPMAQIEMGVFASTDYLRRKGTPARPAQLLGHDCLSATALHAGEDWRFTDATGDTCQVSAKGWLCMNDPAMLMELALHGAGIALLPLSMAEDAVAQGRLVRVLPQWRAEPLSLQLVYLTRRHQSMAVRKLIDHLAEHLNAPAQPRPSLRLVSHREEHMHGLHLARAGVLAAVADGQRQRAA